MYQKKSIYFFAISWYRYIELYLKIMNQVTMKMNIWFKKPVIVRNKIPELLF